MFKIKKKFSVCLSELKVVNECWQTVCADSEIHVMAIVNSLQQVSCCQRADLKRTQLNIKFPDIKSALIVKLVKNCERAFQKLEGVTTTLHKHLENVHLLSKDLHKVIEPALQLEGIYERTATEPSMIEILLWFDSMYFIMNQSYAEKLDILEQLSFCFTNFDEKVDCKQAIELKDMWNNNNNVANTRNELFKYCSHLLVSK